MFAYGFIGYVVILGVLGAIFYKKSHTASDFMLGGRSLGYWTTAIAAHASDMSIWMFMGLPAKAYQSGIQSILIPFGLMTGMYITWKFIAAPLRIATEKLNSDTLSTYFQKRFNDTGSSLRLISAFLSLWFFTFYIASGLVGMGDLFGPVFHMDYHTGIFIGLLITIAYTFFGGFSAIAQSHFFQGIFLVIMMVLVPLLALFYLPAGSLTHALTASSSAYTPHTLGALLILIITAISWGMGYFGQPHILVNFMGIKDPKTMPKAMRVGMLWQFFTFAASVSIGLIGILFFTTPLQDAQLVFVEMTMRLFPELLAGCILCSVVAAGLTTIATQMLVSSSIIAHDLYGQYINKKASQKAIVRMSRYGLMVIPCISFCIAWTKSSTVFGLVEYAWMGLGASFGPAVFAALYLPKTSTRGITRGMIAGGIIATIWPLITTAIPSLIPAFLVNFAFILRTPKK